MGDAVVAWRLGGLAVVVGWVGLAAVVSLAVFFVVGGPFGFVNDVANAALAMMAGTLAAAWLRSAGRTSPALRVATSLALVGAAVAVLGSVLVILEVTGYFLAGLVSAAGFALVGVWLVAANLSAGKPPGIRSSGPQTVLGVVAGAVMVVGLANVPGIVSGIDDQAAAPAWLLAAGSCWGGTYVLMPIWCLRVRPSSHRPAPGADPHSPLHGP